jgi:uncharacterized integral membrane protein
MTEPASSTGEPPPTPLPRDRKRDFRLIAVGVVAVLLIWFALENHQTVRVHFWVVSTNAALVVVIVISGFLGAAIGSLLRRRRRQLSRTQNQDN